MTLPDNPETGARDHLRELVMVALTDCCEGRLAAEDFVQRAADLLRGLPLFPDTEIARLGLEAGAVLDKSPAIAIDLTMKLVSSDVREIRALAAAMMARLARYQPGFWADTARHLIADEDWEIRDLAARVFDSREDEDGAAEFHLDFVRETVQSWVTSPDYLIRRAAAQSLTGYAIKHPEFRRPLLDLLTPLLEDDKEYVRRTMAATLRSIGRVDANTVFDFMESYLTHISAQSSEIFRLALDNPFAEKRPERRTGILNKLVQ